MTDQQYPPLQTAADYLARADDRFWIDDDREGAIADCTAAIQLDPNNSKAFLERGLYRDTVEEDPECAGAFADYTEAIRLDPNCTEAYGGRANIYIFNLDDRQAAIGEYTKIIEIDPLDDYAYTWRGVQYYVLDDFASAMRDYTKSIEIRPTVEAYIRRSQ